MLLNRVSRGGIPLCIRSLPSVEPPAAGDVDPGVAPADAVVGAGIGVFPTVGVVPGVGVGVVPGVGVGVVPGVGVGVVPGVGVGVGVLPGVGVTVTGVPTATVG